MAFKMGVTMETKEYKESQSATWIMFCSKRWRLTYLIFCVYGLLFLHRANFSLGVVCMVKSLQKTGPANINNTLDEHMNISATGDGIRNQCNRQLSSTEDEAVVAELDWKKSHVSLLLSSYFYGSIVLQIPAGRLADKFGAKHLVTGAMLVHAIGSLLTPLCARTSLVLVFVLRVVIGLASGLIVPPVVSMFQTWAPPSERTKMMALGVCGSSAGTTVAYFSSGFLCVYGFDNGWPSIFYTHGVLTLLFVCIWWYEAYSSPSKHPRISQQELSFIKESKRTKSLQVQLPATPWMKIVTSRPMWANLVAHLAHNWTFFTLLINVPLFLEEAFQFDIKQNGVFSALPNMFSMVSTFGIAYLAQFLIKKRILKVLTTRKMFTAMGFMGCSGCLVAAGHITCELRYAAVALLCLACIFSSMPYSGCLVNHAEFSGQFAGTTYGITNGIGVISALLAALLPGYLTTNGLAEEWQNVFYIAAGVSLIGAIVYITCASSSLQDWAITNRSDMTINVAEKEIQTLIINENVT